MVLSIALFINQRLSCTREQQGCPPVFKHHISFVLSLCVKEETASVLHFTHESMRIYECSRLNNSQWSLRVVEQLNYIRLKGVAQPTYRIYFYMFPSWRWERHFYTVNRAWRAWRLTICRCKIKGSTFSSVILRLWLLVRPRFKPVTSGRKAAQWSTNWANRAISSQALAA